MVKNLPANAGDARDVSLIPWLVRSPGGGNGNPLQYSCWENPMDRGTWRAADQRVTKNHTAEHRQTSLRLTNISLLCFVFNMVVNHGRCCQVAVKSGNSADQLPEFEFYVHQLCDLEQAT